MMDMMDIAPCPAGLGGGLLVDLGGTETRICGMTCTNTLSDNGGYRPVGPHRALSTASFAYVPGEETAQHRRTRCTPDAPATCSSPERARPCPSAPWRRCCGSAWPATCSAWT